MGPCRAHLHELAASLLHDIADGKALVPSRIYELADAVLGSDLVKAAQAVRDADARFVLRRGIELAALVLEASREPVEAQEKNEASGG